jgi:hypothetical protein
MNPLPPPSVGSGVHLTPKPKVLGRFGGKINSRFGGKINSRFGGKINTRFGGKINP